ncbi:MAG: hypothetical protein J7K34_01960 [Flavobacteriaceae bacterium]|nr:hypothetical protein [Flavobacteriaceae bacterium]
MKNKGSNSIKRPKSLDKKVLSIISILHPYVKQRLKVAESLGIIPKNMYKSNEIIDDIVLEIYENKTDKKIDINQLKLMMFSILNKELFKLFKNEEWHKNSISTKILLDEELALLEEKFTIDSGFDLIMNEELEDISYHQHDGEPHLLESDAIQFDIADFLDLKDKSFFKDKGKQNLVLKMYGELPLQSSNIVDLHVLGKLKLDEICKILVLHITEVEKVITFVKDNFRKYLV